MRTASKLRFVLALIPALLLSSAKADAAVDLPDGKKLDKVDFERHIMGIFGRAGCKGGGCHGSFQGKGGSRLSLFGYEPDKDFVAVTRDSAARRINLDDPDNSLLLLKATGQVEHGGSVRFSRSSWQYQVIREWIAAGAPSSQGRGAVKSVAVNPPEMAFKKAGDARAIQVKATFTDGSVSDITCFCDFRTNDEAVAEVSNLGEVKSLKAGSTAIVVSYRGNVLPVRIMV